MSVAMHDVYYYVAAVKGNFPWPNSPVRLRYGDHWFQVIPPATDRYANVVLELSGTVPKGADLVEQDRLATIMHRFLSALSWSQEASMEVHAAFGGFPMPTVGGTRYANVTMPVPNGMWLPQSQDRNALRALALVKEARAAQASFPTVAFLWFYKAVEVSVGHKGHGPEKFYQDAVGKLWGRAREAYDSLQLKTSLEKHMRKTRRNAMAHGAWPTCVDPDDIAFVRATRAELPLIAQLAELAIAQRFRIYASAEMSRRAREGGPDDGWTPFERLDTPPAS